MICASHSEKFKGSKSAYNVCAEAFHDLADPSGYKSDINPNETGRNWQSFSKAEAMSKIQSSEKIAEKTCTRKVRKDAVRLVSTVISFPKSWPDAAVKELAEAIYSAHGRILEEAGMASAFRIGFALHFDEKSPHMHEYDIPLTADGRLSAKAIFTKNLLKAFHKAEFEAYKVFEKRHPNLARMESYTYGSKRVHKGTLQAKEEENIRLEKRNAELRKQNAALAKKPNLIKAQKAEIKRLERDLGKERELAESSAKVAQNAKFELSDAKEEISALKEDQNLLRWLLMRALLAATKFFALIRERLGSFQAQKKIDQMASAALELAEPEDLAYEPEKAERIAQESYARSKGQNGPAKAKSRDQWDLER